MCRGWALPFGPRFRLRRNHAEGAFPPFGFNPITQGGGGGHFAASPTRSSKAVWDFDLSRHGRTTTKLGFPRSTWTGRRIGAGKARTIRLAEA